MLRLLPILIVFSMTIAAAAQQQSRVEWYKQQLAGASRKPPLKVSEFPDAAAEARLKKERGLFYLTVMHAYDSAIDMFIRSLSIEDSLGLAQERVFTCIAISDVHAEIGEYHKSNEWLEEALETNRKHNDTDVLVFILMKQGKLKTAMGRQEEALEHYEIALKYEETMDDPSIRADAFYNMGVLFTSSGDFERSLESHRQALTLRRKAGDKTGEAMSLNEIGDVYLRMKNYEKALANLVLALQAAQKLKSLPLIAACYNNIGAVYHAQGNIERAVANLLEGLDAAQDSQEQQQLRKSYEYLALCEMARDNPAKALEYKDLFIAINDFIHRERTEQQVAATEYRYNIDKRETRIADLESIRRDREKQLAEQIRLRNTLFTITGLGIVIVFLVSYLYLTKRRANHTLKVANQRVQQQNVELQQLNGTKDKFFSIISHDLKGPLNSLSSFSSLLINHTDSLSKDEIRMLAKDLDKSLKNLFDLLENLLEWSRSQTGNIEFKPSAFDVNILLKQNAELLHVQAQNKGILIVSETVGAVMVYAHKNSINTVIRNLMSNAIKFTPAGGKIFVSASADSAAVVVKVRDTGVGIPAEVIDKLFRIDTKHSTKGTADEKGTGLGLVLCKDFVEKNGGIMRVESEVSKGSTFSFSVPAYDGVLV